MDPHRLFEVANAAAFAAWVLLLVAPRSPVTRVLVHGGVFSLLFAGLYLAIVAVHFDPAGLADFGSLEGVMRIFQIPWIALAAWVHYLAFDLFVGAWIGRDARARDVPRWQVVPCQALTFLFGPLGLLLYVTLVRRELLPARAA